MTRTCQAWGDQYDERRRTGAPWVCPSCEAEDDDDSGGHAAGG